MSSTGYRAPPVQCPTEEQIATISKDLQLNLTTQDVADVKVLLGGVLKSYQRVDELVEPLPETKYPRVPGYRPAAKDNPLNAWYWRCDISGAADGILAGKKVAIKDNVAVSGVPMMNGSKILEGYVPEYDATVVTRILDAGGRIIGKSVCEDLCLSGSSFTCHKGPVHNPHDPTRSAGGSSGGSAALVAAGEVDMAIGGDQGGSIRLPACWCGVVGLKPTYGLVPYTGAIPIEISLDHLGPLARNVADCARLLQAIAGPDGLDSRHMLACPAGACFDEAIAGPGGFDRRQNQRGAYFDQLTADVHTKKVAIVMEGFANAESDVMQKVKDATAALAKSGITVDEVSIPEHADGVHIFQPVIEGAYETMIRGNGNGFGWNGFYSSSLQEALARGYKTHSQDMSATNKYMSVLGEYMRTHYNHIYYAKAQNLRRVLSAAYDEKLKHYDALIMPTIPFVAHKLPAENISFKDYVELAFSNIQNTCGFNLTGHPALTLPVGKSGALPVGMMIVGRHFDDQSVLNIGLAVEKLLSK